MAVMTSLPAARAALIDQSGRPTPQFYRFLETLTTAQAGNVSPDEITAINVQLAELQAEIAALPSAEIPKLQVEFPILSQGLLQNGFAKLALNQPGDSGAGALKGVTLDAWGRVIGTTDATITGTAGRVTVTNGDAAAGPPTIDLATVADSGGGALLKFVRDAWGRITGTSTPTTTDLAEGSNLYFTVARVLATALSGLSTATNAVITAADSVLVALGKLQAQISANVTAITGKLAKSANLSDVSNTTTAVANLHSGFTYVDVDLTTAQTLGIGSSMVILFDQIIADTLNEDSASTGSVTFQSTGVYLVYAVATPGGWVDGSNHAVICNLDGTEVARLAQVLP